MRILRHSVFPIRVMVLTKRKKPYKAKNTLLEDKVSAAVFHLSSSPAGSTQQGASCL